MDGKKVADGRIERTAGVRFSADETFDVGMDLGTPVIEDYGDKMPFKFTGTIQKVTVDLKPSTLSPADEQLLEKAQSEAAVSRD